MLLFQGVVKFDAVYKRAIQHISLTKNEGVGESHPAGDILLAKALGMANALSLLPAGIS
jgi:hypothetical protein